MHRPFRFAPPPTPTRAIVRTRLLAPLARRFSVRVVTVEAGAGFGKSTLLAQAVAENALAPRGRDVWLTCEPSDVTGSVFLDGLLAALDAPPRHDGSTVSDVCEAVWSLAPGEVCIVLDDAHHLSPDSGGEEVLRRLVVELPGNGHLVVAARRLPALAHTRLVVRGEALDIPGGQLALDDEEAAALAVVHGVDTDIVTRAGGWPALAELHAHVGSANARRFVWDEVVATLPGAEQRAFLFLVSVGAADADALLTAVGEPFDRDRIAALPLVAADDGALSPHPLWAELLADRTDPVAARAARQTLAEVLAARGSHTRAFELFADTENWDRALAVLFDACNVVADAPRRDQLVAWNRQIPVALCDRPEVTYLLATIARADDPWSDAAMNGFGVAARDFRHRGDTYREIFSHVRRSQVAWLRGDRGAVTEIARRGAELVDEGWPIRSILALSRAAIADIDGSTDQVLAELAALEDVDTGVAYLVPLLQVFAALGAGDGDAGVAPAEDAARSGAASWSGTFVPAIVDWARGNLAGALAHDLDRPIGGLTVAERSPMLALQTTMSAHLGRLDAARASLAALDALAPEIGDRELLAGYRAVAGAAVAIAGGDECAAARELETHLAQRPLDPVLAGRAIRWLPALPYLFHARSRALLDQLPSGPARQRALEACRALLAARAGEPWSPPELLDDADALLTVLPAPLAAELVVHAAAHRVEVGPAMARLVELAPTATRVSMQHLAAAGSSPCARAARALLARVPIPPTHRVRIEVVGPARLLLDGVPVESAVWRRQRVRQLVCALVAHREIRRSRLGTLLWPEFDEASVSANLRLTLSYLQSLLEPARPRGHAPWFLQQEAGVLRLHGRELLEVDAWELEDALDAATAAANAGAPSIELGHLQRAIALWRGDVLDEVAGEEWAEPTRERTRGRFVRGAVRAGQLLVAAGRLDEAEAAADAALAADRWCEAAYEVHAAARRVAGDADGVRRANEAIERRRLELGLTPDPSR